MHNKTSEKGIVLITTLLVLVIVCMLATAICISGKQNMELTQGFKDRELALVAAETGAEFAMACFENNVSWGTPGANMDIIKFSTEFDNDNPRMRIKFNIDQAELMRMLKEEPDKIKSLPTSPDRMCLTGMLLDPSYPTGNKVIQTFYITFNESDSNGITSTNNLENEKGKAFSLIPNDTKEYNELQTGEISTKAIRIPAYAADVYVTGISGKAKRTIRVMFALQGYGSVDSVLLSEGNSPTIPSNQPGINTNLACLGIFTIDSTNNTLPIMRSNMSPNSVTDPNQIGINIQPGSVNYGGVSYIDTQAKINLNKGYAITTSPKVCLLNPTNTGDNINGNMITGSSPSNVPNITFDNILENNIIQNYDEMPSIDAGVYVFSAPNEVKYYSSQTNYDNSKLEPPGQPDKTYVGSIGPNISLKDGRMTINSSLKIAPASDSIDFQVKNGMEPDSTIKVVLKGTLVNSNEGLTKGGVKLDGILSGNGSIFSRGDIQFQPKGTLDSSGGNTGLALYTESNVTLSKTENPPPVSTEDVDMQNPADVWNSAFDAYLDSLIQNDPTLREYGLEGNKSLQQNLIILSRKDPALRQRIREDFIEGIKAPETTTAIDLTTGAIPTVTSPSNVSINIEISNRPNTVAITLPQYALIDDNNKMGLFNDLFTKNFPSVNPTDQRFMGLIYAKGDLFVNFPTSGGNLTLSGAVIVGGKMNIQNVKNLTALYDLKYLGLIKQLSANQCNLRKIFLTVL